MSLSSHSVGEGHQAAGGYLQLVRLVVVDPVGYILYALLGQDVGGLPGFGQAGAHPAAGGAAAEVADDLDGLADGGALVGFLMQHLLGVAVSHQFPAALQAGFCQLGVVFAHGGVDADGGGQAVGVQGALEAPETDAGGRSQTRSSWGCRGTRRRLGGRAGRCAPWAGRCPIPPH